MRWHVAAALVAVALVGAACSSSGGPAPGGNTTAPAPTSPTPFPTASNANNPCDPASVPQTIDTSKYGPGDLIAAREIPVAQLTGARAWRVLYVSIGVDDTTLLPVCGTVVAPDSAGKVTLTGGTANMLAWSHGTVGLQEKCQPSTDPNTDIFGTQPNGLGAVGYGSASAGNLHQGQPQDGVLQTAINRGWTVTATDYFAGGLWPASQNMMPYFVATMSGAAVLDSARAAAQVLAGQYGPALKATSYDVLTWGWSQGGHAAFWAAQLGRGYYAHTAPKQFTPALKVVGTAVVAPGSTFVAGPHDPQSTWGTHWFDREMHQTAPMTVGAKTVTFSLGVPLFGNYMSAWPQWSRTSLAAGAGFPAYPAGAGDLSQDAILTQQGIATTNQMLPYCFDQQFPFGVPYSDAAKNAYFVQPIWGQPGPNGQYQGQLDKTCNTTTDSGIKQWCSWLLYNEPGPAGTSSYDKVPLAADGSMLPVFIGQGEDDLAVHCINTSTSVPVPADCLSRQLYDQLSGVYCSNGSAKAALQLHLWRATQSSPAEHNDIPGLVSDNGHLAFSGSPLDEFMSAALAGTGPPAGCNASVANP